AARANLANPAIRTSQVAAVEAQILQQEAQIAAARADAGRARAQLEEARANRQDLQVIAPFAGTVATRTAEPGEVVAAGTPIVTLVDLGQVYLRGFVPEGEIGRVRVGQPARVYLDSAPRTPIEAVVSRIDPQASFTPENTYFREDRVKQVVGVKLGLRGAVGFAKPGMPADGEILVEGSEWPAARKRGQPAPRPARPPDRRHGGRGRRTGDAERAGERRPPGAGPLEALRPGRGRPRHQLRGRRGRDLRPHRARRRGQDVHLPDPGRRDGGERGRGRGLRPA